MATPSVARLGHVGLHVEDLEKEKAFYRDIIGLTVTDEDPELGMVFMSARPEEEHHELMLCGGRNVGAEARVVQQVSFRCDSLEDVLGFYRRFKEHGVKFDVVSLPRKRHRHLRLRSGRQPLRNLLEHRA